MLYDVVLGIISLIQGLKAYVRMLCCHGKKIIIGTRTSKDKFTLPRTGLSGSHSGARPGAPAQSHGLMTEFPVGPIPCWGAERVCCCGLVGSQGREPLLRSSTSEAVSQIMSG